MKGINSIISEEDVKKIKEMIRDGYKNIDISKLFGLKPGRISDIRRGKTFSWVIIQINFSISNNFIIFV